MRAGKILFAVVVFLLAVGLAGFLFKTSLLNYAFGKAKNKALSKYNLILDAQAISYSGVNAVLITNATLYPVGFDTLLQVKSARIKFSLASLLFGKIKFDEVETDGLKITICNLPGRSNFSFLKRNGKPNVESKPKSDEKPFYQTALAQLELLQNKSFNLKQTIVAYKDSSSSELIHFPNLLYRNQQFKATVVKAQNTDTLHCFGEILPAKNRLQLSCTHSDTSTFEVPFIKKFDELKLGFASINLTAEWKEKKDEIEMQSTFNANKLFVEHWRLAAEPIVLSSLNIQSKMLLNSNGITIDSSTVVKVNELPLHLFARYETKDTHKILQLKFAMPEVPANSFFSALPQGVFNSVRGIDCKGTLAYKLNFSMNTQMLDSLIFESEMMSKNLAIQKFGTEDFTRIRQDFIYQAFVKGVLARQIEVAQSNPDFTPLHRINGNLIASVLQAEDPSFMRHRGFLPTAFRESFIKNLKEKRFARGGSTITMQLVKNVFLSHNKNIARKAEEALIVYLIENLNLVSKERMLEVYLNVIEWGPNVFGIGEASRFYYNKKPAELTLQESIFLAGIIPNPRVFKYHVEADGTLKPHFIKFYEVLINRMIDRGTIDAADTIQVMTKLKFKGAAQKAIMPVDEAIEDDF